MAQDKQCHHLGVEHPVAFSCASARGYDLVGITADIDVVKGTE